MSITLKINMPLTAWNEINRKVNCIKSTKKDFEINVDDYRECDRYGKLLFDLNAVEIGAKTNIEKPEYYITGGINK